MFWKKDSVKKEKTSSKAVTVISVLSLLVLILFIIFMRYLQRKNDESTINVGEQLKQTEDAKARKEKAIKELALNEISHGKDADYVEIYNASNMVIDMSGYKLTVGTVTYTFPDNSKIGSGEFSTVHFAASGGDVKSRLQFDDSETVCLYDKTGQSIDYINIPVVDENESYSRQNDGTDQFCFETPTENKTNEKAEINLKSYPVISVPSGMYSDEVTVNLSAKSGEKIYYTLDGSDPTTESTLYTNPLTVKDISGNDNVYSAVNDITFYTQYTPPEDNVDKATVLKAIAVDAAGNVSSISSATYFMDYTDRSMYKNIPIISIVSDPDNLFDYRTGMYIKGEAYGNALLNDAVTSKTANFWKIDSCKADVQYYEPDGILSYAGNVSMSILKDAGINQAQKGLKITGIASDNYSDSGVFDSVSFADGTGVLELNNGEDDYLAKSRSNIVNTLVTGTSVDTSEDKYCAVFIDGEYWGVYLMKNVPDSDYISGKYKVSKPIVVNGGVAEDKEDQTEYDKLTTYMATNDLNSDDVYKKAQSLIDTQSIIDYYSTMLYVGDTDFFKDNGVIWKARSVGKTQYEDGRWRWILGDAGNSLGLSDVTDAHVNHFAADSLKSDVIFSSLMCNSEFRSQFADSFKAISDKEMSTDNVNKTITEFGQYSGIMTGFYERFQDKNDSKMYAQELDTISEFFTDRRQYIEEYMKEYVDQCSATKEIVVKTSNPKQGSVTIDSDYSTDPDTGVTKAFAENGEWVTLTAHPAEGYQFVKWVNGKNIAVNGADSADEADSALSTSDESSAQSSAQDVTQTITSEQKIKVSANTSVTAVFSKTSK